MLYYTPVGRQAKAAAADCGPLKPRPMHVIVSFVLAGSTFTHQTSHSNFN